MTALSGPFKINATSGNDATASGVGPTQAVTTQAQFSSGSTQMQVSSSTGMSQGDVVYVPSNTSGRKFNIIASIDSLNGITCDYQWGDSSFGSAIYVGGKRATLGGLAEVFDQTDGFDCDVLLETDVTMNSTAVCGSSRRVKIYSDSTTQRTITTNQQYPFSGGIWHFEYLTFHSTYGSTARLFRSESTASAGRSQVTAYHCIFGDANNTNNFQYLINGVTSSTIITSAIVPFVAHDCVFVNLAAVGGFFKPSFYGCHFKDLDYIHYPYLSGSANAAYALTDGSYITGCFFENCTRIDYSNNGTRAHFYGCVFDGLAGSNFLGTLTPAFAYSSTYPAKRFYKNLITNSSVVGDNVVGRDTFIYNTSTNISGLESPTTLSSDPYVDRANGDFDFTSDAYTSFAANNLSRIEALGFISTPTGGGGGVVRITMNGGIDG